MKRELRLTEHQQQKLGMLSQQKQQIEVQLLDFVKDIADAKGFEMIGNGWAEFKNGKLTVDVITHAEGVKNRLREKAKTEAKAKKEKKATQKGTE